MRFFCIAAASVLAAHAVTGLPSLLEKRCSIASWVPTPDGWKSLGVDDWIRSWWNSVPDKSGGFVKALADHYMLPDSSSFQCSVHRECQPNCDHVVSTGGEGKDAQSAWFTLVGIENLNYWLMYIWNGINLAQTNANSFAGSIVADFSTAESIPPNNIILFELLNFFGSIFSIAVAPFKGGILQPVPIGIANAVILSVTGSPDLTLDKLKAYGEFVGTAASHARSVIEDSDNALMEGRADHDGHFIWEYLQGGQFALPTSSEETQSLDSWLQTMLVAGGINALWKSDRTYIVSSDSPDCRSDTRGPSQTRYCTEDSGEAPDGKVHYAYMMPPFGQPYPQPWEPIGSDHMPDDISLKDAIKSSVKAYQAAGFDYTKVRQDRWATAMMQNGPDSPQQQGVKFEGVFTIPVCYDSSGRSITPVRTDDGRRFPCRCGDETAAFATAAGFFQDVYSAGKYCNFCLNNEDILVGGPNGDCSKYLYDPDLPIA
ncbi:MAG: hypothetical protein M1839_003000 [Geoglossum umbratile]|nr:MAG: hypothetical protein M1839_003000 [Geoglossum umbratile]